MYLGYEGCSSGVQGLSQARHSSRSERGKGIEEPGEVDFGGVRLWDSVPETIGGVEAPLDCADEAAFLRRNFSRRAEGSLSISTAATSLFFQLESERRGLEEMTGDLWAGRVRGPGQEDLRTF